jgi:DNA-binding Lrp family transcriptional regulator
MREKILESLLGDPTKSSKQMAEELKITRQRLWKEKKSMEEEKLIWGYTGVVDESVRGWGLYLVLFKTKSLSEKAADISIKRMEGKVHRKHGVRLINVLLLTGPYDIALMFSAPSRQVARRYLELLRMDFEEHLLDKPMLMSVTFPMLREGKHNPDLGRIKELVP